MFQAATVRGSVMPADEGGGGLVVLAWSPHLPAFLHHVLAEREVGDLVAVRAALVDRRAAAFAQVKPVEEVAVGEPHVDRAVGPPLVAEGAGGRASVRAEAQLAGLQVAQFRSGVVRPGTAGFAALRFAGGLRCAGRG